MDIQLEKHIYNKLENQNHKKLIKDRKKILYQLKKMKKQLKTLENKASSNNVFKRISSNKYITLSYNIENHIEVSFFKLQCIQKILENDEKRLIK